MDRNQLIWLFFGFSGRLDRQTYALAGMLLYILRMFPAYRIIIQPEDEASTAFWGGVFLIMLGITLVCHFATSVKRLHDMSRSGWFSLFFLIGDIFVYLALCLIPGDKGPNRYGETTNTPGRPPAA